MSARRGDAEVPANGGVHHRGRHVRVTFALGRCCGCGITLGIRVWPWTGRWLLRTHGLCPNCYQETIVNLEATREHTA